ncbi:MAG: hypothetical protein HYY16_18655 [Planctomycetes bacterium]|nr:hypothetical protein [Planctomycetota bacterium]
MKRYRQDSHIVSLVVWASLCAATAILLFAHSAKIIDRPLRFGEIAGGAALLIFGPVALTLYLARARWVWVGVDPQRGILVGGRRLISWNEILRVERAGPTFRKTAGPAQLAPAEPPSLSDGPGCLTYGFEGLAVVAFLILAVWVLFWLIFFVFIPLLIVPALEVFAPFGDRVKIVTRSGSIRLRHLREADEFLREVGQHVRVVLR